MSLTVRLPGELGAALEAEAVRRGQTPDRVAADLLAAGLSAPRAPQTGMRRALAFAAAGESTSGRSAAEADQMLAEGFGRE
jgi:predicted transcriptional regulator